MLKEYIKNLIEEQKEYYKSRQDILANALSKEDKQVLDETQIITNRQFKLIRDKVFDYEGDEANASYDEGYLRSAELLKKDLLHFIKLHIEEIELNPQLSKDYKEGMNEIYKAIQ